MLCLRFRASTLYRPELTPATRAERLTAFLDKVASLLAQVSLVTILLLWNIYIVVAGVEQPAPCRPLPDLLAGQHQRAAPLPLHGPPRPQLRSQSQGNK